MVWRGDHPPFCDGGRIDLEAFLQVEDPGESLSAQTVAATDPVPNLSQELLAFERALANFPVPAVATSVLAQEPDPVPVVRRRTLFWGVFWTIVLLVQLVWVTRHQWSMRLPLLSHWAWQACPAWMCQPWQEPSLLNLSHAHMQPTDDGYRLDWGVRNLAAWPVDMPHLELTLIAPDGEVLLRRVFSPHELQVPTHMEPQAAAEGALHWRWSHDQKVANFRAWTFYP